MRIGVPKEIKNNENRVALTPKGAKALVGDGHEVGHPNRCRTGVGIRQRRIRAGRRCSGLRRRRLDGGSGAQIQKAGLGVAIVFKSKAAVIFVYSDSAISLQAGGGAFV